jgi:hypothetical protein
MALRTPARPGGTTLWSSQAPPPSQSVAASGSGHASSRRSGAVSSIDGTFRAYDLRLPDQHFWAEGLLDRARMWGSPTPVPTLLARLYRRRSQGLWKKTRARSGIRPEKSPTSDALVKRARRSCSKSPSRSPNRCGALSEAEKTWATTSSTVRSSTYRPVTRIVTGASKPAACRTAHSLPGVPCRSMPWPARRSGPRYDCLRRRMSSAGGNGCGSGCSGGGVSISCPPM